MEKLHAFMIRHLRSIIRITWMNKVTHKDIPEQTGLPSMEDLYPVDWTPHEEDSLLSTVFWSQKERAPSTPVQGYHKET